MSVKDLLPKTKHDFSTLERLEMLTDEEIKPIIYDLLEWLQDYNWPVADGILQILIKREKLVFPYIQNILNGDDLMWKYWIMDLLIPTFSNTNKIKLKLSIENIIKNAIENNDKDDILDTALKCYKKCYGTDFHY